MKNILKIFLIATILVEFPSCMKKDNYPLIPAITYNSIVVNSDGSLTVRVNFTCGAGDIGYPAGTATSDFFIETIEDSSGHYVPELIPGPPTVASFGDTVISGYSIPDITPTGSDKELSGQIQIIVPTGVWDQLPASHSPYFRFVIWIQDRAGNFSNRILTPAVQNVNE